MIRSIKVTNFKNHRVTEIQPVQLTVLVGPNGAGKTSLLEALWLLARLSRPDQQNLPDPGFFLRDGQEYFEIALAGEAGSWQVQYRVSKVGDDPRPKIHKDATHTPWEFKVLDSLGDRAIKPGVEGWWPALNSLLPGISLLHPLANRVSALSVKKETIPQLGMDGFGLPSLISYLMTTRRDLFEALEKSFSEIIPSVQRIGVRPALIKLREDRLINVNGTQIPVPEEREVIGDELVFDTLSGKSIPAQAMSSGSLLTLALLTLVHTSNSGATLLLDDIEQGLHPRAQRELITALRTLLALRTDLQVIFTTHSPYILDELALNEVWVLAPDAEGCVACCNLAEHPDSQRALQILTTGEFVDAEGEDWVVTRAAQ